MKTNILFALALLLPCSAHAQNPTLTYRQQDPFLFCHEGQDIKLKPDRCWYPIAPYTGGAAWLPNWWCWPNPDGKEWDSDDVESLAQYQSVCPKAEQSGEWDGRDGTPETVPFTH